MNMKASYNALVSEHMPYAEIVYDRYHMQAQFGKDEFGAVRLNEVGKHSAMAELRKEDGYPKAMIKEEKKLYSDVKRSRWILLTGKGCLSDKNASSLERYLMTMQILHCAMP